ncbi:MAG: hypothetical protein VX498_04485 [Myxococcota bacterium]|nr:hypothetical protein [Myxococcota bacterium]
MTARSDGDPAALLSDLRAAIGETDVLCSEADLRGYSRDLWPKLTLRVRDLQQNTPPTAVVRPRDEAAVE